MARPAFTPRLRRWVTVVGLALGISAVLVVVTQLSDFRLGILERLELSTLDLRFQLRGPRPIDTATDGVVILQISENSFKSLPEKFPWPRSYYAHILRNLKRAGARAVGIDLIFNDNDGYSSSNDDSMRAALKETGIAVLAAKGEQEHVGYTLVSTQENFNNIYFAADSAVGYVDIRSDLDGTYRLYGPFFVKPLAGSIDIQVPTLGFAVLNRALGLPPFTVPDNLPDCFLYAGRPIPKYDASSMLINFYGPNGTFPVFNFEDVIDDESFTTREEMETGEQINTFDDYLQSGVFRGKIVLIGVTIPEYKDLFPVPLGRGQQRGDNLMYGVEIHANVVENVLRNDFLRKESAPTEILLIVVCTTLSAVAISLIKGAKTRHTALLEVFSFLFSASAIVLICGAAIILFSRSNYVLSVVSPMLAVAGGYVASTTYHFMAERRQRLQIKSMFSTYVNPSVVDQLIANPEKLRLGGQREELTVLFSDIEGFTGISEGLRSDELVTVLNIYLSKMARIILRNLGTLDKYVGDAIVAFWGAPIPQEDHALRACVTALEMQEGLVELHKEWEGGSKPRFRTRIGINTGEMVVGNMGGAEKVNYTVIGDSVNLASRLEGANKEYGTSIMVSHTTYEMVKHKILGRSLDTIAVKGRAEPVTVYELIQLREKPLAPEYEKFLECYAAADLLYRQRKWSEAIREFERALAVRPQDRPAKIYIERARIYASSPPPADWNGVFVMKTK